MYVKIINLVIINSNCRAYQSLGHLLVTLVQIDMEVVTQKIDDTLK